MLDQFLWLTLQLFYNFIFASIITWFILIFHPNGFKFKFWLQRKYRLLKCRLLFRRFNFQIKRMKQGVYRLLGFIWIEEIMSKPRNKKVFLKTQLRKPWKNTFIYESFFNSTFPNKPTNSSPLCRYFGTSLISVTIPETIVCMASDGERLETIIHPPFLSNWLSKHSGYSAIRDPKTSCIYLNASRQNQIMRLNILTKTWSLIETDFHGCNITDIWVTERDTVGVSQYNNSISLISLQTGNLVIRWDLDSNSGGLLYLHCYFFRPLFQGDHTFIMVLRGNNYVSYLIITDAIDLQSKSSDLYKLSILSEQEFISQYHDVYQDISDDNYSPTLSLSNEILVFGGRHVFRSPPYFRIFNQENKYQVEEYKASETHYPPADTQLFQYDNEEILIETKSIPRHVLVHRHGRTKRYQKYVGDTHVVTSDGLLFNVMSFNIHHLVTKIPRRKFVFSKNWRTVIDSATHDELSKFLSFTIRNFHTVWCVEEVSFLIVDFLVPIASISLNLRYCFDDHPPIRK